MKSRVSNTNNLNWNSSLLELAPSSKPSKTLEKLFNDGYKKIQDLLWVFPLRIQSAPKLSAFTELKMDELFLGAGTVISIHQTPSYGRRGKGRVTLFNASVIVKDQSSEKHLTLKFFNVYPSFRKQIESKESITFMGEVTEFRGTVQIVNPKINPPDLGQDENAKLIEYPTVNKTPGKDIKKIINLIPSYLWEQEIFGEMSELLERVSLKSLIKAFSVLHGKDHKNYSSSEAMHRVVFEEFFNNQLKVLARKLKNKKLKAIIFKTTTKNFNSYLKKLPFQLTPDQLTVLQEIQFDFKAGSPMMRMIQGDVGSGKTSVALISTLIAVENKAQVALMCPTETLASQHFRTFIDLLGESIKIHLLVGSTTAKDKKEIYKSLKNGETQLIIGTHSLIQEKVIFKNLGYAIIDEQHKFGVEQRQTLYKKGNGVHTLIMSATPIPRTLQLVGYGDLDISTIKTMPGGRKGTKTRVITADTYGKYLSFIKTRIGLGEQVYIVAPAIEESETLDIRNVQSILGDYKKFFPDLNIETLHGQLSSEQKSDIIEKFEAGNIDILISTTVIEVGINILNSTVMAIYNPDRFGLSSLHQLRGRVGRGSKPGFCFLVANGNISKESLERVKIIEKTNDGFEIAEADLKNRGAGNLFGPSQSGHMSGYRLANIFEHFSLFEQVAKEIEELKVNHPEELNKVLLKLTKEVKITATI